MGIWHGPVHAIYYFLMMLFAGWHLGANLNHFFTPIFVSPPHHLVGHLNDTWPTLIGQCFVLIFGQGDNGQPKRQVYILQKKKHF